MTLLDIDTLKKMIAAVPPLGPGPIKRMLKVTGVVKAELRRGLRAIEQVDRDLKKRLKRLEKKKLKR